MKKILFITFCNPEETDSGDKRYTWNILQGLKKNNEIHIHVVAYSEKKKERNEKHGKREKLYDRITYVPFRYKNVLRIGLSFYPAMIANRKTGQMIDKVREILTHDSYDAVYVNMFRMSYMIEYIKEFRIKNIFISHNVESSVCKSIYTHTTNIFEKIVYYLDFLKTAYWEKRYLSQYDSISAICDVDVETYRTAMRNNVFLLPPVVDIMPNCNVANTTNVMIVCGTFTWRPKTINLRRLLTAKNILDISKANCNLYIVGHTGKQEIDFGNKIPGVFLSGSVPSVDPYYDKASVVLVPELIGGGFKLKIAEAVSHNLPIVAIKGSVTDKQMIADIHYLEADNFEELVQKGIRLIFNKPKREELVRNAHQLFQMRYSVDYVHNQLINNM